jgi:hypothetical protein
MIVRFLTMTGVAGVITDAMKDGRLARAGIVFANRRHILVIDALGKHARYDAAQGATGKRRCVLAALAHLIRNG